MNYNQIHHLISELPGAQRIAEGLNDHRDHRHTPASCLVRMARPRLAKAGLMKALPKHDTQAELDLYPLLASESN